MFKKLFKKRKGLIAFIVAFAFIFTNLPVNAMETGKEKRPSTAVSGKSVSLHPPTGDDHGRQGKGKRKQCERHIAGQKL